MKNCNKCFRSFVPKPYDKLVTRMLSDKFCSLNCLSSFVSKNQCIKRRTYWDNQSQEEVLKELTKRFESFVIKKNGCWDWDGCKSSGYGIFMFRGKPQKAHRVSWVIHKGSIPNNMWILHTCDNRSCSNPEHLFLGNNEDNMKDMAKKGRGVYRTKITKEQVFEIRRLLNIGVKPTKLAKDYNVSNTCIYYIQHNMTWKDINYKRN